MTVDRFDIHIAAGRKKLVQVSGFPLPPDRITMLFGESGIGKSLIGKALFGLLDPEELTVVVNGEAYRQYCARSNVADAREKGFFVFQEPSSHLNPLMTLSEQTREGSLAHAARPDAAIRELWTGGQSSDVDDILPIFPTPFRPSGGEKQRLLAAMAFTKMDLPGGDSGGGLFVFDEPTGSLDREARDRFLQLLFTRYRHRRRTILFITHDYSIIGYIRKHHRDLESSLHLLELSRRNGDAIVGPFDPQRYLAWLEGRTTGSATPRAERPILRVEGGIQVFGKILDFEGPGLITAQTTLDVRAGDLVYLKAASGIGKTTAVKVIMGLQRAGHFRMTINGVRLGDVSPHRYWRTVIWGRQMTMAFQHADEALNLRSTVDESLSILPAPSVATPEGRYRILSRLFDPPELSSLLGKKVAQLSGGQKQRLNLLRAFALSTPLLILDEPLNALDFDSIGKVLDLMEERRQEGQAILLISHNEDIFDAVVAPDRIYRLTARPGV